MKNKFKKGDLVRNLPAHYDSPYTNINLNDRWIVVDVDPEGDLWLWHIQSPRDHLMLDFASQYIKIKDARDYGV